MKKLFLIIYFLFQILVLNAQASKVGVRVYIDTGFTVRNDDPKLYNVDRKFKNKAVLGLGVDYVFNIDDGFSVFSGHYFNVANKLIFVNASGTNNVFDILNSDMTIKNLFGLKLGVGYSFNEKFNVEVFVSVDVNKFKTDMDIDITSSVTSDDSDICRNKKVTKTHNISTSSKEITSSVTSDDSDICRNKKVTKTHNIFTSSKEIGYGLGFSLGYNIVEDVEMKLGYKLLFVDYKAPKFKSHMVNLSISFAI